MVILLIYAGLRFLRDKQWGTFSLSSSASATIDITLPIRLTTWYFCGATPNVSATEQIGISNVTNTVLTLKKGVSDKNARTGRWMILCS